MLSLSLLPSFPPPISLQKAEQEVPAPSAASPAEITSEELQDKAPVITPSTGAAPVEAVETAAPTLATETSTVAAATTSDGRIVWHAVEPLLQTFLIYKCPNLIGS